MISENLLSIKNLKTHFTVGESVVKAVDGVSFNLEAGKTFAIVGESGSGKSITALSIMGLLPNNLAQTERGEILFDKMKIAANPKKTKTGQYSTSEEVLSYLAKDNEFVQHILEFRSLSKLQNTYINALPEQILKDTGKYIQSICKQLPLLED